MPTTYTGDPTATQSPSDPPGSGTAPELTLPADGDAANVASIAQAFKVVADYLAWERAPFPASGSSTADPLKKFRSEKLHTGFGLDAFALPRGRFLWFEEGWTDLAAQKESPPIVAPDNTGPWFGPWSFGLFGSAAQVYVNGAAASLTAAPWGPICGAYCAGGTVIGSAAVVEMGKRLYTFSNSVSYIEASLAVNGSGAVDADSSFAFGIGDGTIISGASVNAIFNGTCNPDGVIIGRDPFDSPGFWKVVSKSGTGSAGHVTSVAFAKDSPILWQCYIIGPTAAPDSAAHVLHFINGTLVADHAVDMATEAAFPFLRTSTINAGDGNGLNVGRVRIVPRLELFDAF